MAANIQGMAINSIAEGVLDPASRIPGMNFQVVRFILPRIEVNNIMALSAANQIKSARINFCFGLLIIKLEINWVRKIMDQTIHKIGSLNKLTYRTWSPNIALFDLKIPCVYYSIRP
jgi:hypothetical protein